MGNDIVYLIGKYEGGILQPLLAPFLFNEKEVISSIVPDPEIRKTLILDRRSLYHPNYPIKPGEYYSLFCWEDGAWSLVRRKRATGDNIQFSNISINGLYQLRSSDSHGTERPFLFLETGVTWY